MGDIGELGVAELLRAFRETTILVLLSRRYGVRSRQDVLCT